MLLPLSGCSFLSLLGHLLFSGRVRDMRSSRRPLLLIQPYHHLPSPSPFDLFFHDTFHSSNYTVIYVIIFLTLLLKFTTRTETFFLFSDVSTVPDTQMPKEGKANWDLRSQSVFTCNGERWGSSWLPQHPMDHYHTASIFCLTKLCKDNLTLFWHTDMLDKF